MIFYHRLSLSLFLRFVLLPSVLPLYCFECFDRSRPCTRSTNCSGSACILYENMPKRTSVSFCLLISPVAQKEGADFEQGCWRDDATSGIECVCTREFCNFPRDQWTSADLNLLPLVGLKMLQKNPFVDYEYLDDERAAFLGDGDEANGRLKEKQRKVTEEEENAVDKVELTEQYTGEDLMPMELTDYFEWEKRFRQPSKSTEFPPEKSRDQSWPLSWPSSRSTTLPSAEPSVPIGSAQNSTTILRAQQPIDGTIRSVNDGLSSAHFGPFPSMQFLFVIFICLNHFYTNSNAFFIY